MRDCLWKMRCNIIEIYPASITCEYSTTYNPDAPFCLHRRSYALWCFFRCWRQCIRYCWLWSISQSVPDAVSSTSRRLFNVVSAGVMKGWIAYNTLWWERWQKHNQNAHKQVIIIRFILQEYNRILYSTHHCKSRWHEKHLDSEFMQIQNGHALWKSCKKWSYTSKDCRKEIS